MGKTTREDGKILSEIIMKDISFIYVYYNTPVELEESIKSISSAVGNLTYEVIVVDNNSSLKIRKTSPGKVKIISNKINKGFGRGVNQGVEGAKGKFLVIINPDTLFKKNSVKDMIAYLNKNKKVGVIGPSMVDGLGKKLPTISSAPKMPDMLFAFSFLNKIHPTNKYSKKYWLANASRNKTLNVDVLSGACLVLRKNIFEDIGGFDERFFMYFEESDLCMRIKNRGYRVVYFPQAEIVHYVAGSNKNKTVIENYFNKSRFQFTEKYYGLLIALFSEFFFRLSTRNSLFLLLILSLSLFLNLFRIDTLVLFLGDQARDFLVARNILLRGDIPFLGIPSSISWLHQGPLAIYLIALAMFIGGISVTSAAVLFSLIGVLSTYLIYKLTSIIFGDSKLGLYAALYFATSPLQVINARMPYHTSPIPLFAIIFFWFYYLCFRNPKKFIFFLMLSFGLLLQVELSNAVLILLIAVLFLKTRKSLKIRQYLYGLTGLLLGILPFIIHDLSNKFIQTGGFALWIVNRIRLFLGIASREERTISQLPDALERIWQQLIGIIYPESLTFFWIVLCLSTIGFIIYSRRNYNSGTFLIISWILVPLFGFMVHAAPGVAYFPLVFPAIAIFLGIGFYSLGRLNKIFIVLFLAICFSNAYSLIANNFYLTTDSGRKVLPPYGYNYGNSVEIQNKAIDAIINDAGGNSIWILGGGYIGTINTGVDSFKFLALSKNAKLDPNSKLKYTIYEQLSDVRDSKKILYTSRFIIITKNEN